MCWYVRLWFNEWLEFLVEVESENPILFVLCGIPLLPRPPPSFRTVCMYFEKNSPSSYIGTRSFSRGQCSAALLFKKQFSPFHIYIFFFCVRLCFSVRAADISRRGSWKGTHHSDWYSFDIDIESFRDINELGMNDFFFTIGFESLHYAFTAT